MHVKQQQVSDQKFFKLDSRGSLQEETSDDEAQDGGAQLVRTNPVGKDGKQSVGVSKVHPWLARLAGDPSGDTAAALAALQQQVLLERSRRGPQTSNSKRYFTISTTTIGNGTFQHIALSGISVGTKTSDRTDDIIVGQTLQLQLNLLRIYTTNAAADVTYSPTIRWVLWRDKVPATVGTATATLGTSTNPPASNVEMYSRLGQSSVNYNSVAVRSPDTFDRYHVYKTGHIKMNHHTSAITPTATVGTALPYSEHMHIHQDLHDVELTFQSESATAPMINALYFSFFSDMDYTSHNFSDTLYLTSDLAFRDKQL